MRTTKHWSLASLIIGAFATVISARADLDLNLAWNPNPEPDIDYYRVYVGTASRQYTQSYSTAQPFFAIPPLPDGAKYYFAVTAVNSAGLESDYSDEISTSGESDSGSIGTTITPTISSTSFRLTVSASPGISVTFESSTNLVDWQLHSSVLANAQGLATLIQSRSSLVPGRFFRVRPQ